MSRTQFRAKSGALFVPKEIETEEEKAETTASGKIQATMHAARSESWFWPEVCTGTAGNGCEPGDDFAWQQGILQPCWQQAGTGCFAQHAGKTVCAGRNGTPASMRLQMMVNASFIIATVTSLGFFC